MRDDRSTAGEGSTPASTSPEASTSSAPATQFAALHAELPLPAAADIAFDRLARIAKTVIDVPTAAVTLVGLDEQIIPGAAGLAEPMNSERRTPLSSAISHRVMSSSEPVVIPDAANDARVSFLDTVQSGAVRACAGMPVTDADGRSIGALCVIDTEPRQWTTAELDLLRDLAFACSTELQMRQIASQAERHRARTDILLALSESLSTTTAVTEIARLVQALAGDQMGARFGGIAVLNEDTAVLTYADVRNLPGVVQSNYGSFPLSADLPSALVASSGEPVFYQTLDSVAAAFPDLAADFALTGNAFAYLPLVAGDRLLGTMAITWRTPRFFTADDRDVLLALARYTAQALERAMLLEARHEIASTLQRALLPELPGVEGYELAGRYQPTEATDAVGGDWYDAFALDDGSLVIMVGDVMGHDSAAAATMGQLRATLRALAISSAHDPAAILDSLENVMRSLAHVRLATAVFGFVQRDGDVVRFTWCNAGHLAPLLVEPGRDPLLLTRPADRLLGLRDVPDAARVNHSMVLAPGSTLVLYTDGLVESRGHDLADGLTALLHGAQAHRDLPLPALLDSLFTEGHDAAHRDDTVLFALRT